MIEKKISKHQKFDWSEWNTILTLSCRAAAVRVQVQKEFLFSNSPCDWKMSNAVFVKNTTGTETSLHLLTRWLFDFVQCNAAPDCMMVWVSLVVYVAIERENR